MHSEPQQHQEQQCGEGELGPSREAPASEQALQPARGVRLDS
jgi:hypothetical protein